MTSAGCYGVPEDDGVDDSRSDLSSFTTVPWFCDPCKAGISPIACVSSVQVFGVFVFRACCHEMLEFDWSVGGL